MEYCGTGEIAKKWGYSQSTICKWCRDGKIQLVVKAKKEGGRWKIPKEAECPKKIKTK